MEKKIEKKTKVFILSGDPVDGYKVIMFHKKDVVSMIEYWLEEHVFEERVLEYYYFKGNPGNYQNHDPETRYQYNADNLLYHAYWDWLMPVVEKIEDLVLSKNHNPVVTIEKYITVISDNGESILVECQEETRIEGVYKAVVEFIKWYNQQSK